MTASSSCFQDCRAPLARLQILSGGLAAVPPEGPDVAPPPASSVVRLDASTPDEDLAAAARAGNARAAAILMRRHTPRVRWRLITLIGGDDVDDHVQDVFIRLFEQLPRMRDPSALRGFLAGITLRVACSELRRRRRSRTSVTVDGDLPEPDVAPSDHGPPQEAAWRLEGILRALAPSTRRVFVLRYVEKLELSDLAARMGISVATAKRHLARAAANVAAMVRREPALAEYVALHQVAEGPRFLTATEGLGDELGAGPRVADFAAPGAPEIV